MTSNAANPRLLQDHLAPRDAELAGYAALITMLGSKRQFVQSAATPRRAWSSRSRRYFWSVRPRRCSDGGASCHTSATGHGVIRPWTDLRLAVIVLCSSKTLASECQDP